MNAHPTAMEQALAKLEAIKATYGSIEALYATDRCYRVLRAEHAACKDVALGDGSLGGMRMFLDFMHSRYQREARIKALMQARRLQLQGVGRNRRIEYLMHAASCRQTEDRLRMAEARALGERAVGAALGVA